MKTVAQSFSPAVVAVVLLLLLGFPHSMPAADGDGCLAISSAPFTISNPGSYCLTKDISITTGTAIQINSSDVTLDLGGHTLNGLSSGSSTSAAAITDAYTLRRNITVRNGTIRGFGDAVYLIGTGMRVEAVHADLMSGRAIEVDGSDGVIRGNQVVETGSLANPGAGIFANGDRMHVLDNDVDRTIGGIGGFGILASGFDGVIEGNRITNTAIRSGSTGIGVQNGTALVINNRITSVDFGITMPPYVGGVYRDNITFSVNTRYTGGTSAGNNQ